MNANDLETTYELLAVTLDGIAESEREIYLAKLALLMADALDDPARAEALIKEAALNLERRNSSKP